MCTQHHELIRALIRRIRELEQWVEELEVSRDMAFEWGAAAAERYRAECDRLRRELREAEGRR